MKRLKYLILALTLVLLLAGLAAGAAAPRAVYVLPAVGSINPGLAEFIVEGIRLAERENAEALVIELDTPGGLETSMRQIVQAISNAKVPVVVYVYPRGARAASAGVFITMAANVAAMAPGHQHRRGPPGLHRHGQDRQDHGEEAGQRHGGLWAVPGRRAGPQRRLDGKGRSARAFPSPPPRP